MGNTSYSEKLRDPRWQKKRLDILNRDGFACTYCHDNTKTLHVHHLDYIRGAEPWEYENDYLLTLCEECHEELTNQQPIVEAAIIKQIRIKLKDAFIRGCAAQLFQKFENLNDLVYLLWELLDDQEYVDYILSKRFNQKKRSFMKLAKTIKKSAKV